MRKAMILTGLWLAVGLHIPMALGQYVKIDQDPSGKFDQYRTYGWKPGRGLTLQDMASVKVHEETVQSAVKRQLKARGILVVDQNPDFYVTFIVGGGKSFAVDRDAEADKFTVLDYTAAQKFSHSWQHEMVKEYRKGSMAIDIIDAATNTLVWRAYCRATVSTQTDTINKINKAIEKAFKGFPPKRKK